MFEVTIGRDYVELVHGTLPEQILADSDWTGDLQGLALDPGHWEILASTRPLCLGRQLQLAFQKQHQR